MEGVVKSNKTDKRGNVKAKRQNKQTKLTLRNNPNEKTGGSSIGLRRTDRQAGRGTDRRK